MKTTKKEIMGKERKIWLEESIEEFVENNPNKDSVDIVSHFKLPADVTLNSVSTLVKLGKIIRKSLFGLKYGYVSNKTTNK